MAARHISNAGMGLCLWAVLSVAVGCGLFVDDEARVERAQTALEAGDYRAAIIDLKTVIQNQPENQEARLLLGMASIAVGDMLSAEKELQRAVELGEPIDEVRIPLAQAKLAVGKSQEALDLADPGLADSDDQRYQLWMTRGAAYAQLEQADEALASFQAADALDIEPIAPLIASAQVHAAAGDLAAAETALNTALKRVPDSTLALYSLASLAMTQGQPDRTQQILEQALDTAPPAPAEQPAFYALLIDAQLSQRDLAGAQESLRTLTTVAAENDPTLRLQRGKVQLAGADYAAAIDTLGTLVDENPKNLTAQLLLGAAHMGRGQLGLAESFISGVLQAQPGSLQANQLRAQLRAQQGRAARSTGAGMARAGASSTDASMARGGAKISDATEATDDMADGDGTQLPDPALARRGALLQKYQAATPGDAAATAELAAWVEDYPEDSAVRALLAQARLGAGQNAEAREHYERLLDQYPDQPALLNNLAWVYFQLGDPRAEATASRANELLPDNANVLDTLGWIQAKSGKADEAVGLLRRAYDLSGDMPEIGYHLVFALAESGETAAASELIDTLLADGVSPEPIRAQVEALRAVLAAR